jgi:hypothetical protein
MEGGKRWLGLGVRTWRGTLPRKRAHTLEVNAVIDPFCTLAAIAR